MATTSASRPRPARDLLAAALLLTTAVAVAFWPGLSNGFTNYDDGVYVTANPRVRDGLTPASLKWAWTTGYASNWHPLTWMSHMLDRELFGDAAAGHHASSIVLHLANTLLLLALLRSLTGSVWRSALVAALFGVHPLHVESVAWVAERKDVLSTLFWLLSTLFYVRYARGSASRDYWLSLLLLGAGLCAKPMLVTLPFTLLLLDYWPLRRWPVREEHPARPVFPWRLLREKIPMLVLAAASSVVTLLVQRSGGAVRTLQELSPLRRAGNAIVAYCVYLGKTLWPVDLAAFYPHPRESLGLVEVASALGLLVALTGIAIRLARRRPYVAVGWCWYLGTLVPVLGFVQVGSQALADRYTYVPLIGIFLVVAWGAAELVEAIGRKAARRNGARPAAAIRVAVAVLALVVSVLIGATRAQVRYWHDSISLFERAIAVTEGNQLAHNNLGSALFDAARPEEAIRHYEEAIRISPAYELAHNNLCYALGEAGKLERAMEHCETALRLRPDYPEARNHRGILLVKQGRREAAVADFSEALRLRPDFPDARDNLATTLVALGRDEAARGRTGEAIEILERAVAVDPRSAPAHDALGSVLLRAGRAAETVEHCTIALRLQPDLPQALNNLGGALTALGRLDEALRYLDRSLALQPDNGKAHSNRAAVLFLKGDHAAAREAVRRARENGFEPPRQLVDLLAMEQPARPR